MANNKINNMELTKLKKKIIAVLRKYKIKKAGIFGSYVKGEQKKGSDIDVLIEFNDSLLTLVRIERELEEKLGIKADLLTYGGISPYLKKYILAEEIRII
ncbi:MAG: nucleotidyltransferase family protein [Nanoarchaeota archaeon]